MILHTLWPNSVPSLRPDAPWIEERKKALNRLHTVLTARQTDVEEALKKDLGRCRMESVLCESVLLFDKLKTALTSVEAWARPELVLPILSCPSLDEAIRHINSRAPLAPYLFSKSREEADRYGPHCHFGGDCVNDTFSRLISTQGSPLAERAKRHGQLPRPLGLRAPFPQKKPAAARFTADIPLRSPPFAGRDWVWNLLWRLVGSDTTCQAQKGCERPCTARARHKACPQVRPCAAQR